MAGEERQTRRTLLGALLIVALVGSAVLIFFLDNIISSLRPEYQLVAVVADAPGIVSGSPVWIGGKEVGTVSEVGFLPTPHDTIARLALTLTLPKRLQGQVREDSRVRYSSARLIGEPAVDILPGTAAARVLQPGDTLLQRRTPTPEQLTATAMGVRAGLDTVLVEVRQIAPAVRTALERTRTAFAGMELAMAEARMIQSDLQSGPGLALLNDAQFTASLERARSHMSELPNLLAQMEARTGEARDVGAAVLGLQLRADSLRVQLTELSDMMDHPNSSAARFSQDTAVIRALNAARAELDSLMADVRRNPLRYIR